MNLFYLRIIENYADLHNTLFYVQTENFSFLANNLVFNTSFFLNIACFDSLHNFLGNNFFYICFSN